LSGAGGDGDEELFDEFSVVGKEAEEVVEADDERGSFVSCERHFGWGLELMKLEEYRM
jgi:hypothetical protein